MTEPSAERHIDLSLRSRNRAWGAAFAAALLSALIGGGAALNDAPGDRPSEILILGALAIAGLAVFPVRQQPRSLARRFVAIGVVQILAAGTMMVQGWGEIPIIALINGILVAGWLLAAALFSAATRQFPAA